MRDLTPTPIRKAFVRQDHTPNRVELIGVERYTEIQLHNGSYPTDYMGCLGAGTTKGADSLGGTVDAMNKIIEIIGADGSGDIRVMVGPIMQPYSNR